MSLRRRGISYQLSVIRRKALRHRGKGKGSAGGGFSLHGFRLSVPGGWAGMTRFFKNWEAIGFRRRNPPPPLPARHRHGRGGRVEEKRKNGAGLPMPLEEYVCGNGEVVRGVVWLMFYYLNGSMVTRQPVVRGSGGVVSKSFWPLSRLVLIFTLASMTVLMSPLSSFRRTFQGRRVWGSYQSVRCWIDSSRSSSVDSSIRAFDLGVSLSL